MPKVINPDLEPLRKELENSIEEILDEWDDIKSEVRTTYKVTGDLEMTIYVEEVEDED